MYTYIVIDDESLIRKGTIKKLQPMEDQIACVGEADNGKAGIELIQEVHPDFVILDMQMPIMGGKELLPYLAENYPEMPLIVISGYRDFDYVKQAISAAAIDYILKPFDEDDIKRSLQRAMAQGGVENKRERLKIRCFPRFELIIDDKPMAFKSKKAKELLAYLVHNQGCWINIGTLVYDLFGDWNEKSSKSHFRVVLARLKKELSDYGIENIIETKYGAVRVNISEDICDYYLFLRGNHHLFHGEYMIDYSWAEEENVRLGRICSSE